jgi:hypothetical protein
VPLPQRRSVPGPNATGSPGAEQLQAKLRRLLNADSKENVFFPEPGLPVPAEYATPQVAAVGVPQSQSTWEDKFGYAPGCKEGERTVSSLRRSLSHSRSSLLHLILEFWCLDWKAATGLQP